MSLSFEEVTVNEQEKPRKKRTVELVKSTYHPTKQEIETQKIPPLSEDAPEDIEERIEILARGLTEEIEIRRLDKPRNRR